MDNLDVNLSPISGTLRKTNPSPSFSDDVRQGLAARPRQLHPKYLYDALGSALFEAICRLPWYPITRAEQRLLDRHGAAIASLSHHPSRVIELGCGSGDKLARILRHLTDRPPAVHLVDVSETALAQTRERVESVGPFQLVAHHASYEEGLHQALDDRGEPGPALVLFLGSNIGNFDPPEAFDLLSDMHGSMAPGDRLLLGVDLVKSKADLVLAYDDPLGVTAAFNRNLLVRMNRELGATFDLHGFDHRAVWNREASRMEMHLVSRTPQRVEIPGADLDLSFDAGETIWTESSYKFEPDTLRSLVTRAGFTVGELWIDCEARFALTLLQR